MSGNSIVGFNHHTTFNIEVEDKFNTDQDFDVDIPFYDEEPN